MQEVSDLEPVQYRPLADSVAKQIRAAIIQGRLKPGDRLVEKKLAASLRTSQPTVREALRELAYQGFVRKVSHKATFVTQLGIQDIQKIMDVRLTLEKRAVELATSRMNSTSFAKLEEQLAKMEAAAGRYDREAFHGTDLSFHQIIWKATGNEFLEGALSRITFSLFAFVLSKEKPADLVGAVSQHRMIVDGLRTGDPERSCNTFITETVRFWKEHHGVPVDQNQCLFEKTSVSEQRR